MEYHSVIKRNEIWIHTILLMKLEDMVSEITHTRGQMHDSCICMKYWDLNQALRIFRCLEIKQNVSYHGLSRGGNEELLSNGYSIQYRMMRKFWRWTVVMVEPMGIYLRPLNCMCKRLRSERSQSEKVTYCMIPTIWHSRKSYRHSKKL